MVTTQTVFFLRITHFKVFRKKLFSLVSWHDIFLEDGKNHTPSNGIKTTATTQLQSNAAALTQKISPAYSPVVDLAIPTGKNLLLLSTRISHT